MKSFTSILGLKPITRNGISKDAAVVAMTGKSNILAPHPANKYMTILDPSLQQKHLLELKTSTKELLQVVAVNADSTLKAKIQAILAQEKFHGALKILCRQNHYGQLSILSIASSILDSTSNTFKQVGKASRRPSNIPKSDPAIDAVTHHQENINSLLSAGLTDVTDSVNQTTTNNIQDIFSPFTKPKELSDKVTEFSSPTPNDDTIKNGLVKATTASFRNDAEKSEQNLGTTMSIIDKGQSDEPHQHRDAATVPLPAPLDLEFDELDFFNLYASEGESSESNKSPANISSYNISEDETTNHTSPSAGNSPKNTVPGELNTGVKHLCDSAACEPFNWNQTLPETDEDRQTTSHLEMAINFGVPKSKETITSQLYEAQGYGANTKLVVVTPPKRTTSRFASVFAEQQKQQNTPKPQRETKVGPPDAAHHGKKHRNTPPEPDNTKRLRGISIDLLLCPTPVPKGKEAINGALLEVGNGANTKLTVVPPPKRASKFAGIFTEQLKQQEASKPKQDKTRTVATSGPFTVQPSNPQSNKSASFFAEKQKQQDAANSTRDREVNLRDAAHRAQKHQNTPPEPATIKRTRRVSINSLIRPAAEASAPSIAVPETPSRISIGSLLCPTDDDYDEDDDLQVLPETPLTQTAFFTPSDFVQISPTVQAAIAADTSPGLVQRGKEKFDAGNDVFVTRVTKPGGHGGEDFLARLAECRFPWNNGKSWIDWEHGSGTRIQLPPERELFWCSRPDYGTGLQQPPLAISPARTPSTLRIKENKAPVVPHTLVHQSVKGTAPSRLGYPEAHSRNPLPLQQPKAPEATRPVLPWTDLGIPPPGLGYGSRTTTTTVYHQQTTAPGSSQPSLPHPNSTTAAPEPGARQPGYRWNPSQPSATRLEAQQPPQARNTPAAPSRPALHLCPGPSHPPAPRPEASQLTFPWNTPLPPTNSLHVHLLRSYISSHPPLQTSFQQHDGSVIPAFLIPQVEDPPAAVQVPGTLAQKSRVEARREALRGVPLERVCCGGVGVCEHRVRWDVLRGDWVRDC